MADIINSDNNTAPGTTVVNEDPPQNANASKKSAVNFDGLQINVWYFRSVPGIMKVIEWVIGIICIACASPPYFDAAHWFVFVAVFCFIFTFVWACIHFFSLTTVISVPWLLIEIGYTALATLFYFIAFIVLLVETAKLRYVVGGGIPFPPYHYQTFSYDAYLAAGSFGVFNFIAYAIETLFHAKTFLETRKPPT